MDTKHDNLEVNLLLYDHQRSSEESQYRDSLLFQGFYFSLAVISAIIAAVIVLNPSKHWLSAATISFISSAIFFAFLISLGSMKGARDAANKRRKEIENDSRLRGLVKTSNSISNRYKNKLESMSVGRWIVIIELIFCICWVFAGIAFLLAGFGIIQLD